MYIELIEDGVVLFYISQNDKCKGLTMTKIKKLDDSFFFEEETFEEISDQKKISLRVSKFRSNLELSEHESIISATIKHKKEFVIDKFNPKLTNIGNRIMSIITQRLPLDMREQYPIVYNRKLKGWYIKTLTYEVTSYVSEDSIKEIFEQKLDFNEVIYSLLDNQFKFSIFKLNLDKELKKENRNGIEIIDGVIKLNESIVSSRMFNSARKKFGVV